MNIYKKKQKTKQNIYIMDCKPLPMLPYALLQEEMPLQKHQTLSSLSSSQSAKLPGSVPQQLPAPSLIFNHKAMRSLGEPNK